MLTAIMRYGPEATRGAFRGDEFGYYHPMMLWAGHGIGVFWVFGILWIITWILGVALLIAIIRWIWKKGDKVK